MTMLPRSAGLVLISLASLCIRIAQSFSPNSVLQSSRNNHLHQATVAPEDQRHSLEDEEPRREQEETVIISSNFWGATIQSKGNKDPIELPCVPLMDPTGSLPKGAYVTRNKADQVQDTQQSSVQAEEASFSSSPCCRISLALDLEGPEQQDMDATSMVEQMQSMLEDGLTSFQIISPTSSSVQSWGEEEVYGRFLKETPGTVRRRHAHLTIPMLLPQNQEDDANFDPKTIRSTITDSLLRMGSFDALDCLQLIQTDPGRAPSSHHSPLHYHLEVLDTLKDLQREGLLISVAGKNLSPALVRSAASCGFESLLDFNQLDLNLIDTAHYHNFEHLLLASEYDIPIQASSPLLGGLLTDEWALDKRNYYKQQQRTPRNHELSNNAKRHLKGSIAEWASSSKSGDTANQWTRFNKEVWDVLEELSQKYDVSVTSIALRWLLQLKHVESVVVSTRLESQDDECGRRRSRKQQYRNAFRFLLDDEDVERLWAISGGPATDVSDVMATDYGRDPGDSDLFAATTDGLVLPTESRSSQPRTKNSGSLLWF
mmetsp:Transcript_27361/g.63269  ORF Transcript_27361/g.63269 Transcript_27361/m.63269 type:complete len:543 (-) Transcript_27361:477-2105(-)